MLKLPQQVGANGSVGPLRPTVPTLQSNVQHQTNWSEDDGEYTDFDPEESSDDDVEGDDSFTSASESELSFGPAKGEKDELLLIRNEEMALNVEGGAVHQVAGCHALAIPKAIDMVPDVSVVVLKDAEVSQYNDLRRYLCAGDVINIRGGNVWGHCVLLLAAETVKEFPRLYDLVPGETKEDPPTPVLVDRDVPVYLFDCLQSASNLDKIDFTKMAVVVHPDTKEVCVVSVGGGAAELMRGHTGEYMVCQILMSPFNIETLDLPLFKATAAAQVQTQQNNKWSKRTAFRAYLRKAKLRPTSYRSRKSRKALAKVIEASWKQRPVCSSVPPRVWQMYLRQCSQKPRLPLPSENKAGSDVSRGEGAGAHLLQCGREGVVQTQADKSRASWVCAGPCSHVKTGQCANVNQCEDCLATQWCLTSDDPDPDVAFVEDVLRLMPVKDDRVLPEELVRRLLKTKLWQELNMRKMLPKHRKNAKRKPVNAIFL